ncbi:flagellar assembly protein FliH, partial [Burkholderia multivorans]
MSDPASARTLTAYQRWEMASFDPRIGAHAPA